MNPNRTKIAERGVTKPIALRLPEEVRKEAERLAKREGVSLNRHATEAYLRGVKQCISEVQP